MIRARRSAEDWRLRIPHIIAKLALVVLLGAAATALPSRSETPMVKRCVLGWIPFWDQPRAVETLRANVDLFSYVGLFWYYIDETGQIKPYVYARQDRSIIRFAQSNGVKVFAIVTNLPDDQAQGTQTGVMKHGSTGHGHIEGGTDDDWDWARVARVIRDADRRRTHVAALVELAETGGFDGINIDYEYLHEDDRENFSRFIEELAAALHAKGLELAVAIHPKTGEGKPSEDNGSRTQDWVRLAKHADQLHFMTYGEHWAGSKPGPAASPQWMRRVFDYALNDLDLPRQKVFMGLPLYAESWQRDTTSCGGKRCYTGTDRDLTYSDVASIAMSTGQATFWDETSQTAFFVDQDSDPVEVYWYEDQRSVARKLQLREEFGICNIALWRLGGEDPGVWDAIRDAMQVKRPKAEERAAGDDGTTPPTEDPS